MSALPPKADILGRHEKGLLLTQSGHSVVSGNRFNLRCAVRQYHRDSRSFATWPLSPLHRVNEHRAFRKAVVEGPSHAGPSHFGRLAFAGRRNLHLRETRIAERRGQPVHCPNVDVVLVLLNPTHGDLFIETVDPGQKVIPRQIAKLVLGFFRRNLGPPIVGPEIGQERPPHAGFPHVDNAEELLVISSKCIVALVEVGRRHAKIPLGLSAL